MSDTRRPDPLRREPPTIDLKAKTVPSTSKAASAPVEESATAVEPIAAVGLDPKPFAPEQAKAGTAAGPGSPAIPSKAGSPAKPEPTRPEPPKPEAAKPEPAKSDAAKPSGGSASSVVRAAAAEAVKDASAVKDSVKLAGTRGVDATREARPAPEVAKPEVARPDAPKPARAAAEGPTASPVQTGTPRSRGAGGLVGAGLLGGVVGAALALGADRLWVRPTSTGLETRLAALESRPGPASPALEGRVGSLETEMRQARDTAQAARTAAESAAARAAEVAGRPPAAVPADTEAKAATDALAARVAALEGPVRDVTTRAGDVAGRVATLETLLTERTDGNAAAIRAAQAVVATLQAGLGTVQAEQRSLSSAAQSLQTATATADRRTGELESRLAALSTELAKVSPGAVQAALRVVLAGRLTDALRSGTPLAPLVSPLEKLGTPAESLAVLRRATDAPPPSVAELQADWKPLSERLVTEARAPADGLGDRLLRMADKVVTVRVIGDGSGTDLPGLIARIDAALSRNAAGAALTAWEALPAAAKAASTAWGDRLKARAALDDTVRRIGQDAVAALDAATR